MDARAKNRERLLRRVTCSDLVASRSSAPRRSSANSVSSASGSGCHSLAASCEPSIPEGLDNDLEQRAFEEEDSSKQSSSPTALRSPDGANQANPAPHSGERRSGKERLRILVKMTSAASLLRKMTATVQKHAVQLSCDYAPPPSVLFSDAYRSSAFAQAGGDAAAIALPKQKTSLSTSELRTVPPTATRQQPAELAKNALSGSASGARFKSPNRMSSSNGLKSGEPRRQSVSNEQLAAGVKVQADLLAGVKGRTASCASESHSKESSTSQHEHEHESERIDAPAEADSDDELDIAGLGDALQSHLKALMLNKRSSNSSNDSADVCKLLISRAVSDPDNERACFSPGPANQLLPTMTVSSTSTPPMALPTVSSKSAAHSPAKSNDCSWSMFRFHKRKSAIA